MDQIVVCENGNSEEKTSNVGAELDASVEVETLTEAEYKMIAESSVRAIGR